MLVFDISKGRRTQTNCCVQVKATAGRGNPVAEDLLRQLTLNDIPTQLRAFL